MDRLGTSHRANTQKRLSLVSFETEDNELEVELQRVETPSDEKEAVNERKDNCLKCCGVCFLVCAGLALFITYSCGRSIGGWASFLGPSHPELLGGHSLGMIRARLPAVNGEACGLQAQIMYPADDDAELLPDAAELNWIRNEVASDFPCFVQAIIGDRPALDPPRRPKAAPEGSNGWPIVVFSHGLSGTLEMYTQFCREMAAKGNIVVAVEHQDGTALYAETCENKNLPQSFEHREGISDEEFLAYWRTYLDSRQLEYNQTFTAVMAVAEGGDNAPDTVASLQTVLELGDATKVVAVGHSFGGVGLYDYAQHVARQDWQYPMKGLMLYDAWFPPATTIPREETAWTFVRPLPWIVQMAEYAANDEAWGGDARRMEAANKDSLLTPAFYIKDTSHQWIAETAFWAPRFVLRQLGLRDSGEGVRSYEATTKVCLDAIDTILDPTKQSELDKTVADYGDFLTKL